MKPQNIHHLLDLPIPFLGLYPKEIIIPEIHKDVVLGVVYLSSRRLHSLNDTDLYAHQVR